MFWNKKQPAKGQIEGMYFNQVLIAPVEKDGFTKIVPLGRFANHPYGDHTVEVRHLREMADNFKNGGTDLLVDYEHRSIFFNDTKAAGWSYGIEAREDGLYWKYPEFTKAAAEMISNKEYKYFSPVYHLDFVDKYGRHLGAKFINAALTNMPIMDTEIDHIPNSGLPENQMSKEFLKKLGLPENATEAQVEEKLTALRKSLSLGEDATLDQVIDAAGKKPDKPEAEAKVPVGDKPKSKAPAEGGEDIEKRIKALEEREAKAVEREAEALVNSAITEGKIQPALKEVFVNAARQDFEGTKKRLEGLAKNSAMPAPVQTLPKQAQGEAKPNALTAAAEYMKTFNRQPQK